VLLNNSKRPAPVAPTPQQSYDSSYPSK
jgi:hypothetical protein